MGRNRQIDSILKKYKMQISPELKETVRTHTNIHEVYFSDNGQHYLSIWKDAPTGIYFGQFVDGRPVLTSRITHTAKREAILGIKSLEESKEQKLEANLENKEKEGAFKKHKNKSR